jgi:hypothetical protein
LCPAFSVKLLLLVIPKNALKNTNYYRLTSRVMFSRKRSFAGTQDMPQYRKLSLAGFGWS